MGGIGKAVKKAFKSVGSLVGLGGSGDTPSPTAIATDPTPTTVATSDVSADTGSSAQKKSRRGFASTQTGTIATSGSDSGTRNTLG